MTNFSLTGTIDLANLNGQNGFIINGAEDSDFSGTSVSSAGDINGDGIDDLIVGAPHSLTFTIYRGESYVIYGKRSPFNATFNLSNVNGNNGFLIDGASGGYNSGLSVSQAGDINNDGIDDLIIGAPTSYVLPGVLVIIAPGDSYVVFGDRQGFGSTFELEDLNGSNGFRIRGIEAGDFSGGSVSDAGDVNGDGIDDLIVGATLRTANGQDAAGESYIVYGSGNGFNAELNLDSLNGINGFALRGINEDDNSGNQVSNAGDVNGDGIDDLMIAAPDADPNGKAEAGEVYIVYGSRTRFTSSFNLSSINGNNGFVIPGLSAGDEFGSEVSNAGDVNGDGIDDLIISADDADPNGKTDAGAAYVIFGSRTRSTASFNLSSLNGNNGFVIPGVRAGDNLGSGISNAGDVNGDGIDDLIIGADAADPNGKIDAGTTYVLFGKSSGFNASINLQAAINNNEGFALNGIVADDKSGVSVSNAGDINGDGIDDLVVGAWLSDANGSNSGQSYVIFGRRSGISLNGNNNNNTLNGGSGNDTLTGNGGNDTLVGNGGNDSLLGGSGRDSLVGGSGSDTLIGGTGADIYIVNQASDSVIEGINRGNDRVLSTINFTLPNNVENLTLTGNLNRNGFGNGLANNILGSNGNNRLSGNSGNDTIDGRDGNDIIFGNRGADRLSGGNGRDTLIGANGNDNLNGGLGGDRMEGGAGNDIYTVNQLTDIVIEKVNQGRDRVLSSTNFSLPNNVENLTLTGNSNSNGFGNGLANNILGNNRRNSLSGKSGNDTVNGNGGNDIIFGNDGADRLIGGNNNDILNGNAGKDTLLGNSGNDRLNGQNNNDLLVGGSGSDVLIGGDGSDTLTGGSGSDSFRFDNRNQGVDRITDYSVASDRFVIRRSGFGGGLSFGTLRANQFTFGASASDASDRFIYFGATGRLFYDRDGSGPLAQQQIAILSSGLTLTNREFVIV